MSPAEVLDALDSGAEGLSDTERWLAEYGPNALGAAPTLSPLWLLLDEFRSPPILVLVAAALLLFVVGALGEGHESNLGAVLILVIVVFNAGPGFVQNHRAHRGVEALRRLAAPRATVLRGACEVDPDAATVVPGDMVLPQEGTRVAADGWLAATFDLSMDESSLSGEGLPVANGTGSLPDATSLFDRSNMVFLGTTVARGRGRLVVTETGMRTEFGGIAEAVQAPEESRIQFQREVARFGRRIRVLTLVDHSTRESPAIEVGGSLGGHRVVAVLARLALQDRVDLAPRVVPDAMLVPSVLEAGHWQGYDSSQSS